VNRKAYSEDAQGIIRRQRAAIEKLQADNTNMKHELDNSAAARPRPRAPDPAAQLPRTGRRRAEHQRAAGDRAAARDRRRLHSQGSVCHVANPRCRLTPARKLAQIEAEKKRASALDARIRAFDAEALAKRRSMGGTTSRSLSIRGSSDARPRHAGVNAAKEDTEQVSKQIKLLDNQLEKALVRLNEAVNRNKLLREDIDHLRKERLVFDTARSAALLRVAQLLTVHTRFARRLSASCTRRGATWRTWWTSPTSRTRPETRRVVNGRVAQVSNTG
jgi:hypothetical protein